MSNSLKFGTSGLRGLATDLIGAESRRYAAAFLRYLRTRGDVGEILVGRDLRESSPEIAHSVISGLDVPVVDCGALPTPALALEAMRRRSPAIMITGSHIPADRNGLKFYRADGEIDKADEAGILAALGDAPEVDRIAQREDRALARYLDRHLALLPRGALHGKRIGVWQHSSVARDAFMDALEALEAPEETVERVVGVYRVLKPQLLAAYEAHLASTNAVYEPPTCRILTRCIADERRHVAAGETIARHLLRTPALAERARAAEARLWALLEAAGGATGAGPLTRAVAGE